MNHYQKLQYTCKNKVVRKNGARISPRLSCDPNANKGILVSPSSIHFDLNSRYLRRYIIEVAMYLKSGDRIMILMGKLHNNYNYWEGISKLQKNGLGKVIIDDHIFLQIRASVIKNVKRDSYLPPPVGCTSNTGAGLIEDNLNFIIARHYRTLS